MTPLYVHHQGKVVLTGDNAVSPEVVRRIAWRHMEAAAEALRLPRPDWAKANRAMDCANEALAAVGEAFAYQRRAAEQQTTGAH